MKIFKTCLPMWSTVVQSLGSKALCCSNLNPSCCWLIWGNYDKHSGNGRADDDLIEQTQTKYEAS